MTKTRKELVKELNVIDEQLQYFSVNTVEDYHRLLALLDKRIKIGDAISKTFRLKLNQWQRLVLVFDLDCLEKDILKLRISWWRFIRSIKKELGL